MTEVGKKMATKYEEQKRMLKKIKEQDCKCRNEKRRRARKRRFERRKPPVTDAGKRNWPQNMKKSR